MFALLLASLQWNPVSAHDAHGRANAPLEARRLKNPIPASERRWEPAQPLYERECASCHGPDGRARTTAAARMKVKPTNLSNHLMDSMSDGEIFWTITHGVGDDMPRFDAKLSEPERWQIVLFVRELRKREKDRERKLLGDYDWKLPPGFPMPNVPAENPMTAAKVELGRHLFYDKRLSLNQKQACATCHKQELAFTDGRARGLGSTGQMHSRSPMSLVNVAYVPVLTWANPRMTLLEKQAMVPIFGEDPVELGMSGQETILIPRLKADPVYQRLFAASFPEEKDPFTLAGIMKGLASFQRTILSADSPFDRYRRGDDPNAMSEAAKRGEALFFGEKLECFHCHGGLNFTGSEDYFERGFAEIEFHNTGLYNLKGATSYPEPNVGIYEFSERRSDVGKFRAPTLRNIALTAPYMHDGSVKTLDEVLDHYSAGGRTIAKGPLAGNGSENPNKSEFIKAFELSREERKDVIEFLKALTDESVRTNPAWSNPWVKGATPKPAPLTGPTYTLKGEVAAVFAEDGMISLYHDAVPGLMAAVAAPNSMDFLVASGASLTSLRPGQKISAAVRRRNRDYILENIRTK